ncbi:MAG: hypothetical protein D6788_00185 [Planctomycetota bacterium]|nr:MAG: hypothetical protein D6788_00185 [Planctomycetota bacterium]
MKAMFEARYLLPEDANPSEEAIAFFACTNGVFNLWPYWREFVQSMASRMGLPRLTVPTYRIEEAFTGPGTVERRTRRRRTASRSARSR